MKFDQLNYFIQVAKLEHLGNAARTLGLSSSALSHSIAALEDELGRELFHREGKKLRLTPHGRLLARKAELIINQMTQLKDEMAAEDVGWEGTLKTAAPAGACSDHLVQAIVKLRDSYPKIQFEQRVLRSAQVVRQVAEGDVDFGIALCTGSHVAVEKRPICQGDIFICVRKDHPLLSLPAAEQMNALKGYPVAGPRPLGDSGLYDDCAATPFMREAGALDFAFDSYDLAQKFMHATNAWSFLPDWVIKASGGSIVALEKSPVVERYQVYVVWPKDRGLNRPLKALIDLFSACLASSKIPPDGEDSSVHLQAATSPPKAQASPKLVGLSPKNQVQKNQIKKRVQLATVTGE